MTREYELEDPFDVADARRATKIARDLQANVEENIRDNSGTLALAEKVYRLALAKRMAEFKAEGVAWTSAGDMARGDQHVADLRYKRDVAKGVMKATDQAAFRCGSDRRSLDRLIDWSQRRDLADDHEGQREPARRAA
jgi:hypothetical protein